MTILEHAAPGWLIALGVVAAVAACAGSAWWFAPRRWRVAALPAVRLLFLALLAWCLLMPGRKDVFTEVLKPRFIVAVDRSASMLLRPEDDVPTRWERTGEALQLPWHNSVEKVCEIDTYAFADELGARLDRRELAAIQPRGASTLLRDALRRLGSRYAGLNVSGCLLLSDGIDTREAFDDWAAEPRAFPVYTVRLEPEAAWAVEPDVRVDTVNTPQRVTAGWKSELKAVISGQGTGGGAITVQLHRDEELEGERPVTITAGGGTREVVFELDHPEPGVSTYRVSVPALPGESHTNDNSFAATVQVITSQNHLLYVEGSPRWESKYLTRALRANQQMEPLVFLRGPDGRMLTVGERGGMTAEMRESQLAFFKIVILGNLAADELGEERSANLVKFVETGGSLVLLGGSRAWGESGLSLTPLEKVLPVKRHGTAAVEGEFPVALTDTGLAHPAFAGDPELWETIPPVLSVFPDIELSPGAGALVTADGPGGPHPVVVTHRYGQGKVATIFTDSLWRWQLSPDAGETRVYQRFWDQLIAWMLPEEKDLEGPQIDLFADRDQLYLGEEVELSARSGEGAAAGSGGAIECRITGPDRRMVPFAMKAQQVVTPSGQTFDGYGMAFEAKLPGLHRAVATREVGGVPVESDPISFFVKPFTPESVPRPANMAVLRAIASTSGGKCFEDVETMNNVLSDLRVEGTEEEMAEYRSLWQNWTVMGCLLGLLTLGWVLRKAMNMP